MRENPWHLRTPSAENEQWYRNLSLIQDLTFIWAENLELKPEQTERLSLNTLIDDTLPEDFLGRLEASIWKAQAHVLDRFLKEGLLSGAGSNGQTSEGITQLESKLETPAWKAGQVAAYKNWPNLALKGAQDFVSLEEVLLAFQTTPFWGSPGSQGFLIRRRCHTELQVELKLCPHRRSIPGAAEVDQPQSQVRGLPLLKDLMCKLHSQWMHGYATVFVPSVKLIHLIQSPHCLQHWSLG